MRIQNISGVTNPFSVMRKEKVQEQKMSSFVQQNAANGESKDSFVRTEDGQIITKTLNEKGELMVNITKNNWSKDGVLDSVDTLSINPKNPTVGKRTIVDYEHNEVSRGVVTNPLSPMDTVNQTLVTERKDPITGKTVAKQTYTMSEVPGIYNVTETDALGRVKVISSARKTEDGGIFIMKNMTSLDGTTTTYRYSKSGDGKHIRMYNQIADKNGNPLSTVDRTYDKESENLAHSSVNGRKYTIEQKGKNTIITDEFEGEKTVLNEKSFKVPFYKKPLLSLLGKVQGFQPEQTKEPVIKDLLHTLPGDTLIDMSHDVKNIVPLKDNLDSAFMGYFGILNCNTDEFVVSHELGHAKDAYLLKEVQDYSKEAKQAQAEGKEVKPLLQNPIADNPEFQEAYFNEKAMFIKAFPSFQEEYIDYFIFPTDGQTDRGRKETVAESNAINSQKPMPPEILAMRTQVLQQYFPRTIATVTKLTTPIAVPNETNASNNAKEIIVPEKQIIVPNKEIILT
jgi:hypothetical protein